MPYSNPQQELKYQRFADKVFVQNMSASHAYAEIYGVERSKPSTWSSASRLLRHAKVQASMHDWSTRYLRDAMWAYEQQKKLVEDPKTPAMVRFKILESILVKAGLPKA